jgi:hypothetical protein
VESGYARSALVTDVELHEDHPASFAAEMSRRHRWIRGDWQIAGWLLPRVLGPDQKLRPNTLTALGWWKIFDNLRRSLVPPALLMLLLSGWLMAPEPTGHGRGSCWLFLLPVLATLVEAVQNPATDAIHLDSAGKSIGSWRKPAWRWHVAPSSIWMRSSIPAHACCSPRAAALAHAGLRAAQRPHHADGLPARNGSRRCSPGRYHMARVVATP